jgi:hypothetical protein
LKGRPVEIVYCRPLVEGLLAHFEENPNERVARIEVNVPGQHGTVLIAIYRDGPQVEVVASMSAAARVRPSQTQPCSTAAAHPRRI